MFVRRKKNRSGSTSVVIADKSSGRFTELHVIGVGTTEDEIRQLVNEGKNWIAHYGGQQTISFPDDECEKLRREENSMTEYIVSNIISTSLNSPQRIINKVYDKIGFNIIQDEELRSSCSIQNMLSHEQEGHSGLSETAFQGRGQFAEDLSLSR